MKTYKIEATETYSSVYYVNADSEDKAKDALMDAFNVGLKTPDQLETQDFTTLNIVKTLPNTQVDVVAR